MAVLVGSAVLVVWGGDSDYQMARNLAISHTVLEITKFWDMSNSTEGLRDIFSLSKNEKESRAIEYKSPKMCISCPDYGEKTGDAIETVADYMQSDAWLNGLVL